MARAAAVGALQSKAVGPWDSPACCAPERNRLEIAFQSAVERLQIGVVCVQIDFAEVVVRQALAVICNAAGVQLFVAVRNGGRVPGKSLSNKSRHRAGEWNARLRTLRDLDRG